MGLQYIYLRDKQTTLNTNRHQEQHIKMTCNKDGTVDTDDTSGM